MEAFEKGKKSESRLKKTLARRVILSEALHRMVFRAKQRITILI